MTYEEDNKSLLGDLKSGDRKAAVFIYENYRTLLTVSAIMILKDEEAAKDLVQQFYIDFFEQRLYLKIKTTYNVKAYLVLCIRNRCLNKLRDARRNSKRMRRVLDMLPQFEPEYIMPEDNNITQKLHAAFVETCQQVPMSAKALQLRYFEGLSREEISKQLGISVNTVKNNLIHGLKVLRQRFKNLENQ